MKWFFIAVAVMVVALYLSEAYEKAQQEQTKRIELQLKIEMVKAGITNIPAIKH